MDNPDEIIRVPSASELERYREKAGRCLAKKKDLKDTKKRILLASANNIVAQIFAEFDDDQQYLLIKCLALQCICELELMHKEIALEHCSTSDINLARHWFRDQGMLECSEQIIRAIQIGSDDWMCGAD